MRTCEICGKPNSPLTFRVKQALGMQEFFYRFFLCHEHSTEAFMELANEKYVNRNRHYWFKLIRGMMNTSNCNQHREGPMTLGGLFGSILGW